MVRPLVDDFIDQAFNEKGDMIDDQYMFGNSILVVPVITPHTQGANIFVTRKVVWPIGPLSWFDIWTGERQQLGTEESPNDELTLKINEIGVFVGEGSTVVFNKHPTDKTARDLMPAIRLDGRCRTSQYFTDDSTRGTMSRRSGYSWFENLGPVLKFGQF